MGIPNPPTLGRTVNISFEAKEDKNGPGDYEMFIDIYGTEQDPVGIKILAPEGWVVPANGVKLFKVQEEATSSSMRVKPSKDKKQAIRKLKRGEYTEVFDGEMPQGFRFDPREQTLYDSDSSAAIYEFLVHLMKPTGESDFADPGVRNR